MDRRELKERAKNFLSGGRYLKSLFYTLFVTLLATNFVTYVAETDKYFLGLSLITPVKEISATTAGYLILIYLIIGLFIVPMFTMSLARYFMRDYSDMDEFNSKKFLSVENENYGNLIKIFFIRGIKLFLWTLLLIIPGLIKSYEYFMIPYILAEDPSYESKDVFAISKTMMDGNKMNIFILNVSFFGWRLIGLLIPGAIFLINPYVEATFTQAYLDIKEKKGIVINRKETEEVSY